MNTVLAMFRQGQVSLLEFLSQNCEFTGAGSLRVSRDALSFTLRQEGVLLQAAVVWVLGLA